MSNKLRVAVIGLGNIGTQHARGYHQHPGFELVGFVDTNLHQAKKAARLWGGVPAKTITELAKKTAIDVVSVCVPDHLHFQILQELKKLNLKGGILEKPLTIRLKDSEKILHSEFFKQGKFLVNYTRRFIPEFQKLQKNISKDIYGKFITGHGIYGKGLLHNGSHGVDLARYFLGEIKSKKLLSAIYDYHKNDPTYSVMLTMARGGNIFLQGMDSRNMHIFEMDLFFQKSRIRIIDSGREIHEYGMPANTKKPAVKRIIKTSKSKAMYYAIDNLYECIKNHKKLICTINDAYQAQKICAQ